MYGIKIYRPNKQGKLTCKEVLTAKQVSAIHWSSFNKDSHRTQMQGTTGIKYHRIGVDLKKCVEDDCDITVTDARRKTCSPECLKKRLDRQRQITRDKKRIVHKTRR